jgi:dTDP-4-amino-4,6-dideoxygalactose transaminase
MKEPDRKGAANPDPSEIEKVITKKIRAIVPVHLYGRPVELDSIIAIARRHRLLIIEDAYTHPDSCRDKN